MRVFRILLIGFGALVGSAALAVDVYFGSNGRKSDGIYFAELNAENGSIAKTVTVPDR